jgi:hypothetical protein
MLQLRNRKAGEVVILLALDFPEKKTRSDLESSVLGGQVKLGENNETLKLIVRNFGRPTKKYA